MNAIAIYFTSIVGNMTRFSTKCAEIRDDTSPETYLTPPGLGTLYIQTIAVCWTDEHPSMAPRQGMLKNPL